MLHEKVWFHWERFKVAKSEIHIEYLRTPWEGPILGRVGEEGKEWFEPNLTEVYTKWLSYLWEVLILEVAVWFDAAKFEVHKHFLSFGDRVGQVDI